MDCGAVLEKDFGASVRGMGVNIPARDVSACCSMLETALGMSVHRASACFAILRYGADIFQLHADTTYAAMACFG